MDNPAAVTSPPKRRPFEALQVDPGKATLGAWIQHPDSKDRLRVRRLWCAEHIRAHEQAALDYDAKHGPNASQTADGERHVGAVAVATGLVTGWEIAGDDGRPYDAAELTAAMLDPSYADLRPWIMFEASRRAHFRAEHVAGN